MAVPGISQKATKKKGVQTMHIYASDEEGACVLAYIDGVLVGPHLAAAAAELEERDESERQLEGQDHLHTHARTSRPGID